MQLRLVKDITALLLSGGRGSRMGGVDKGLQPFNGLPLAHHALTRLAPQVAGLMVNANRNLDEYETLAQPFNATVIPDGLGNFAGPLAGFLVGLQHCPTSWLVTAPCDTPLLPLDLVTRLMQAVAKSQADIAMASAPETDNADQVTLRNQPVFCLLRASLLPSLQAFTQAGGAKIAAWTGQHHTVLVPFDQPGDNPRAFFNANTLDELRQLEAL